MAGVPELHYSLSSLFHQYRDDGLLDRIETYALWTIPSVFPRDEHTFYNANKNRTIEYDYQSIGALLVNRLASKLARSLFPANTSFFRIDSDDPRLQQIFKARKLDSVIEYENAACARLFYNASYAQLVQALRLLIITGECLLYRVNDSMRVYSLKDYVVKRNNVGEVLDIVICEHKFMEELDPAMKVKVGVVPADTTVKLYTRIKRQNINGIISWKVTQEINGRDVGTNMVYRDKLCPYIPVVWNFVNGDSYGRGYVEEYGADFSKLSDLSRELMSYELEALRVLHLANIAGGIDVDEVTNAPNGTVVHGNPESLQAYEAGSYQKIVTIRDDLASVEARLNTAFMYTGNTRDAERVTAYELKANAEEAEQVLGGVYSQLAESMHLPLAYLLLNEVRSDIINALNAREITLNIVTGIQALSRNTENQGLIIACNELNVVIPVVAQLGKRFNLDAIADKIFLSNGVNIKEITRTEDELRAIQQAEQQAQAAQEGQLAQAAMAQQAPQQLGTAESAVNALQQVI